MFEHKSERLLPRREFYQRQARHGLMAAGFLVAAWAIGILGYMAFEGMSLIDATVNAAMILGGMGPVDHLQTSGGKLFASFYAILSGIGIIGAAGVFFAPMYHRFLHRFHLEVEERKR